jgi:hypothetical protein
MRVVLRLPRAEIVDTEGVVADGKFDRDDGETARRAWLTSSTFFASQSHSEVASHLSFACFISA